MKMNDAIVKHALLIAFEYNNPIPYSEPLTKLLAMETDLDKAYIMANTFLDIPRHNITIVTDIIPAYRQKRAWDPLKPGIENPRIVQLPYPDITRILREMAQFIENSVRGIENSVNKGVVVTHEIFIYFSCHGVLIPVSKNTYDNALVFLTKRGSVLERRYLRNIDIFGLLFGQIKIEENGRMLVPITKRKTIFESPSAGEEKERFYVFDEEECSEFYLTPSEPQEPLGFNSLTLDLDNSDISSPTSISPSSLFIAPQSQSSSNEFSLPKKRETYYRERGLPPGTNLIVVFDACNSGELADFHFTYDPESDKMVPTHNFVEGQNYPYCVSLAACQNESPAPSTEHGSPFTRCLFNIFKEIKYKISIKELHTLIYLNAPKILIKCKPTICSTINDANYIIPFCKDYPSRDDE
jgi:hypothetical protein